MATVYTIEIETVSSWVNHPPEHIEKVIRKALEDSKEGVKFENIEIKVERKA